MGQCPCDPPLYMPTVSESLSLTQGPFAGGSVCRKPDHSHRELCIVRRAHSVAAWGTRVGSRKQPWYSLGGRLHSKTLKADRLCDLCLSTTVASVIIAFSKSNTIILKKSPILMAKKLTRHRSVCRRRSPDPEMVSISGLMVAT